jgi:ribosome-associated heat shock protein Hsp15
MRIDKYLWCVRYFKTRGLAAEAIKKGHVSVNKQAAKASREVYATDKIILRKDQINYEILVLDIPQSRIGAKLVDMYRKDETPQSAFDHLELLKLNKEFYREPGTGRPTKKDRRDLDEYGNEIEQVDKEID